MTTEFFPERTIRYKTYAKRTLVEGLNLMFQNHPDKLLQRAKATIEFPRTVVDFPSVVVRMFERDIFNAGVGHEEVLSVSVESDSIEVAVSAPTGGAAQLDWAPVETAVAYKVYKGRASDKQTESFTVARPEFVDDGTPGFPEAVPTEVTGVLATPQPSATIAPPGQLRPGDYFYRVTALAPSEAVKFKHYFYTADIEFAVYALSSYDRDLVADTLVQTIAMGSLEAYTNSFFERVYPVNDLYPDADIHFITINSDQIQGFGENQTETPWGAEDDLLYTTSYRVGVFGELYSLPPKLSYAFVRRVFMYPYTNSDPVPQGQPDDAGRWVSNAI